MKLRIKGNSIRLRLSQTEASDFAEKGQTEDSISFGDRRLTYALTIGNEAEGTFARFENDRIEIIVAASIAREWTRTEQVGFSAEQKIPDGARLKILVEKDFACLAVREGEDESDSFPHPNTGQVC